jgi:hypothetical protein
LGHIGRDHLELKKGRQESIGLVISTGAYQRDLLIGGWPTPMVVNGG